MDAEQILTARPTTVGKIHEGSGPTALRRLVLDAAHVSIGYRVYDSVVHIEIVWIIGRP